MKVVTIVGARPQFIKAAPVSKALRDAGHIEFLLHTGQHYDYGMSQVFFDELGLMEPSANLEIGSGSHGWQTGQMLIQIEKVFLVEKPDWVLVYGDTNSTLAGALAAVKLRIPLAHVEAGLRSFDRDMPEENNRVLTDHASDLLFAPTQDAIQKLRQEGFSEDRICLSGDVMYDAALYYGEKAEKESHVLERLNITPKKYILATMHRAENIENPERLQAIFKSLVKISETMPVILPLHPRTRLAFEREQLYINDDIQLFLIDPVGYLDMVELEKNANLIVSDSGGVPKEGFFYRVPSVILRKEAVWKELVDLGWARAVHPVSTQAILAAIYDALSTEPGLDGSPYGDGHSAIRIVNKLTDRMLRPV